MSPARTPLKAVTPGSVKVLMLVEAGIIGFLSYWVLSEYAYNAFFRSYADQILFNHITTYSAVLGLGIGLSGSAVAAMLYRNLQQAKRRLETVMVPKIRGAVDKILPSMPIVDTIAKQAVPPEPVVSNSQNQSPMSPVTAIVPVLQKNEQTKKPD